VRSLVGRSSSGTGGEAQNMNEVRDIQITVAFDTTTSWTNYLMRNNFVEHVNSIMGNRLIDHQRIPVFMGVALNANKLHIQLFC
jgi:hypothetical protein